jgi:hypothetical protein
MFGCDAGAGDAIAGLLTGHDVIATSADVWLDPRTGNAITAHATQVGGRSVPVLRPDGEGHLVGDGAWELYRREADGQVVHHVLPPDDPRLPDGHIDSPDAALLRLAHADELGFVGAFAPDDSVVPPGVHDFARRSPLTLEHDPLNVALWSRGDGLLSTEASRDTFDQFTHDRKAAAKDAVSLEAKLKKDIGDWEDRFTAHTERVRRAKAGELGALSHKTINDYERRVRSAVDNIAQLTAELKALSENQLSATSTGGTRPARHPLEEAAVMYRNETLPKEYRLFAESGKSEERVRENVVLHGIPVELIWGEGGALGKAAITIPGSSGKNPMGYKELLAKITESRNAYPGGSTTFDALFGRAVRDLAGPPGVSPPQSLLDLAPQTFPDPALADLFQRQVAAFSFMQTTMEGARGPSALVTNLMVWDMVADGHVSLKDGLGYLNVMGPLGSVEVGKIDGLYNQTGKLEDKELRGTTHSDFRTDIRAGIGLDAGGKPFKKITPAAQAAHTDRMNRLLDQHKEMRTAHPEFFDLNTGLPLAGKADTLAKELARIQLRDRLREFQARQREIVALYAIRNNLITPNGDMVKALNRYFYADQRTGVPAPGRPNEALAEVFDTLRQKLKWTP